jgi:hypothetical protein
VYEETSDTPGTPVKVSWDSEAVTLRYTNMRVNADCSFGQVLRSRLSVKQSGHLASIAFRHKYLTACKPLRSTDVLKGSKHPKGFAQVYSLL